jgi:acetylornithine deacetylase
MALFNDNDYITKISDTIDNLERHIVTFIQELVRTPSLPGEEKAVQDIIASKMQELNLVVDTIPIDKEILEQHSAFSDDGFPYENRLNLVGKWKGLPNKDDTSLSDSHSLILNGHMDVVSPGRREMWSDSPWSGKVENGRIFGRGSADMKSGFSSALFAVEVLKSLNYAPAKDLFIQSVVGEETGGCGTLMNIIKGYKADAAIIMEPTGLKILPLQSGALSFRIRIKGKSVHACMKNRGINPIDKFYLVLQAINKLEKQRHLKYSNPLFQDPMNVAPISVGTLSCGDWPSSVPDELTAEGRFGIFPEESIDDAKIVFTNTIKVAAMKDDWLKDQLPEVEWFEGQFESGETSIDEPIINTLSACHGLIHKQEVEFEAATYGSDLRLFTNYAGIPAVLYGPGHVLDAHTVNESISIQEVMEATKILALTIVHWCGNVGSLVPHS